ncbi:bone morphogenetic protein 10-like [Pholidichthys leucotaenia]
MAASVFSNLGFIHSLNLLLVAITDLSSSSHIHPTENSHRVAVGGDVGDGQILDAQDFLGHFLSTWNLTKLRPQPEPPSDHKELPEYMLDLYMRFASDHMAVPLASIVRSFRNEDCSPYSLRGEGVLIYPLLFNISMPQHERITIAELRLFTLVRKAQRPFGGLHCKVTIYKIHEGVVWTKEVGKEGSRRDKHEVLEMKDLEELVTKHIHAKDNSWVSFDLTHVVALWRKPMCATHKLEVHITHMGSNEEGAPKEGKDVAEIDIDRRLEGKHNAVMIVFSDDQGRDHKQDKQELSQVIKHENDLPEDMGRTQQPFNSQDKLDKESLTLLQPNLVDDAPTRIRRSAKSESCRRTPLYVDFKDIGWDSWIIQPLGYEAYKCSGVCNPPMTSEVSPTRHAIVQTRLSVKSPERAPRACCVPTKLEPISLLYHENGVITFNHKYEGMVVAECGCR